MDKFQLQYIPTEDLLQLREEIKLELHLRRKAASVDHRKKVVASLKPVDFQKIEDFHSIISQHNISAALAIPLIGQTHPSHNIKDLSDLLAQPWGNGISLEPGKFYVYAHVDPRKDVFISTASAGGNLGGTPFYIGKGCGKRAWDLKRNQGHGIRLKQILDDGFDGESIVKILFENLSESKALDIERKLIYYFGTIYQKDRKCGMLLNLDIPAPPEFSGAMHKYTSRKKFHEARHGKTPKVMSAHNSIETI
jgi:hypothetical protein